MEEISLEDLAMGKRPKKEKCKEKPIGKAAKARIAAFTSLQNKLDSLSVKNLEQFNEDELEAMVKAQHRLRRGLETAGDMVRTVLRRKEMSDGDSD